jgi:6-phosphogluconolactonase/glucosamine-6-phosphate isomerase/deaminase
MIHKTHSPRADHTRVTFEVPAALWAARIVVVVEGPQTAPISTALVQARDGAWRTQLDLPSDQHYHFHYLVDGEAKTDAHADGFATTPQGHYRSLLATVRGGH